MSHLFVDGIRSIAVINGVVRIDFIRFDRDDEKSDKPVVSTAGQLIIPFSRFQAMADQVRHAAERVNASAKPKPGQPAVDRRGAHRTETGVLTTVVPKK